MLLSIVVLKLIFNHKVFSTILYAREMCGSWEIKTIFQGCAKKYLRTPVLLQHKRLHQIFKDICAPQLICIIIETLQNFCDLSLYAKLIWYYILAIQPQLCTSIFSHIWQTHIFRSARENSNLPHKSRDASRLTCPPRLQGRRFVCPTSKITSICSLDQGPQILFGAILKIVRNTRDPSFSSAYNFVENTL